MTNTVSTYNPRQEAVRLLHGLSIPESEAFYNEYVTLISCTLQLYFEKGQAYQQDLDRQIIENNLDLDL